MRRTVAAVAWLLASSLEICGCNLVRDCERVRGLRVAEASWPVLVSRCRQCLSARELASLKRVSDRLASADALRADETVGQALLEDPQVSFYDPAPPPFGDAPESAAFPGSGSPLALNSNPDSNPDSTPDSRPDLGPDARRDSRPAAEPGLWPIPESVFFIYKSAGPGRAPPRTPAATAFVLSVPGRDHRSSVRFLVTARHVVDPEWAHCAGKNPIAIDLRLNRRAGGVGYETIPLESGNQRRFLTPEDGSADIAVARLDGQAMPDLDSYTFLDTPFRLLPTEAELRAIAQGTQNGGAPAAPRRIVTAGMESRSARDERSYPVSDAGVLASTATQPVEIQCGPASSPARLGLWTIEAAVPPGVSGAPVYTTLVRGGKNARTPVLLGVQSISWPDRRKAGITPSTVLSQLIERALEHDKKRMDFYKGP